MQDYTSAPVVTHPYEGVDFMEHHRDIHLRHEVTEAMLEAVLAATGVEYAHRTRYRLSVGCGRSFVREEIEPGVLAAIEASRSGSIAANCGEVFGGD